jgi:hypothetical protein
VYVVIGLYNKNCHKVEPSHPAPNRFVQWEIKLLGVISFKVKLTWEIMVKKFRINLKKRGKNKD